MFVVGKIDRTIFERFCTIVTDEVVLTDTQLEHVRDRHPDDLEKHLKVLEAVISEPDIVMDNKKPNTLTLLKRLDDNLEVILRLQASSDPGEYSNSIISFWSISQRKWQQYLRNKTILYKRE